MNAPREAVVLVHGLWMSRVVMQFLAGHLRREGLRVQGFGYASTLRPFERHAERLARVVREIEAPRVHLVGHSLGGLVVLAALQRLHDAPVGRVVLLGAPAGGSDAARQFMRNAAGRAFVGASAAVWRETPRFVIEPGVQIGAIAGTHRVGLGRFLVALDGPNDGVVTVEETRLPGLADHIVLPVSHSTMLVSRAVAAQTANFLRSGTFAR